MQQDKMMTKAVELVQDASVESFNECFDIILIQDLLRRSLLELYGKLSPSDCQPLYERYRILMESTIAQNAKKDCFMDSDEVKAIQEFVH